MYSIKIEKIDKEISGDLRVQVDVYKNGEKIDTKFYGYAPDTDEAVIRSEMEKLKATLEAEAINAEAQKKQDELDKKADETISSLIGKEI